MKQVARFEKISLKQFNEDYNLTSNIEETYNDIIIPKRATKGSAGYDFFSPCDFTLNPGETIKIPTGIRCFIEDGYVLSIYPRSGLGFKYRIQLNNTVGIIDSDYYNAVNEGHIMIKLTNDSNEGKVLNIKKGEGIAQGIFTEYFITYDDETDGIRTYGFGSTTKK